MRFQSRVIRVTRHIEPCMSYRSKTYTWNDVILVKRSMIRVSEPNGNLAESYTDIHQSVGTSSSVARM
jgi:ABC-type transport system involved in Fe-S cluster assembly fused permease/ATPase subunit